MQRTTHRHSHPARRVCAPRPAPPRTHLALALIKAGGGNQRLHALRRVVVCVPELLGALCTHAGGAGVCVCGGGRRASTVRQPDGNLETFAQSSFSN